LALGPGPTLAMTAPAVFADGLTQDLSEQVDWSAVNQDLNLIDDVVVIDNNAGGSKGVVSGVAEGVAIISAVEPQTGMAGQTTVTVIPTPLVSIDVTPYSATLAKGNQLRFKAMGYFENGSSAYISDAVDWASAEPAKASISNEPGLQGVATGEEVSDVGFAVSATDSATGIVGTASLVVKAANLNSVKIVPDSVDGEPVGSVVKIANNTQRQIRLIGIYSDGAEVDLTQRSGTLYTSGNANASIGNGFTVDCPDGSKKRYPYDAGLMTAVDVGYANISVRYKNGKNWLYPQPLGVSQQITAAVLDSITVESVSSVALSVNDVRQYKAVGHFSDGAIFTTQDITNQVSWSTDNIDVATVENKDIHSVCSDKPMPIPGRVMAVGVGGPIKIIATDTETGISSSVMTGFSPLQVQ